MMRTHFGLSFTAILLAAMIWHQTALAADDLAGLYVGGNFARARNEYKTRQLDGDLESDAQGSGDTIGFSKKSVQRLADVWWADAGYFFTPYVGLDASFIHLGQLRYVAVGTVTGSTGSRFLSSTNEVSSHGPALSAILRLPIVEAFELDLRLGGYFGKTTLDAGLTVGDDSSYQNASKSTASLLAGVGAAYTIDGHWSVRVDYLRVNHTGDSSVGGQFSVNLASVGASYTF